ncbi:growth hormone-inducible soluble protein-like protein [Conidiobolus coronatus NRRL 28638]|uniref:Growth hormone-inducible soluble protein-like protein n=1 Tax=Conidiobolus coronatus (strain ATCC 28846 / CBS 209.66 / NRRL 28638) TaxID=796925 RepID=A0A137P5U6_CONC2|nr:growth hormone-inducible soluble protein-like protein [Conidiobolus coronatus NRRL 28638]|eukprot:KXN70377.1 growth hormone-inducible soluble protein-like protein [Conidiobolus coronatus NRRL 28638]
MSEYRHQVLNLYKRLLYLGREYPTGYTNFRNKLHASFLKNSELKQSEEIEKRIKLGEFVIKEIEAMYHINKYRAMKKRYYPEA